MLVAIRTLLVVDVVPLIGWAVGLVFVAALLV